MSDLISRQAAIDAIEHITSSMSVCVNTDECHGMKRMQRQAVIELANLPSAQPGITLESAIDYLHSICWMQEHDRTLTESARKKGKWIYGENDGQDGWYCSECGFFVPWDYDYYGLDNIDFIKEFVACPHCEAKMESYTGKPTEER